MAPAGLLCSSGEARIETADLEIRDREESISSSEQVLTHCRELTAQLRRPPGGRHQAWEFSQRRSWLEVQLMKRRRRGSSTRSANIPTDLHDIVEDLEYSAATVYVFCYLRRYSANGPTVCAVLLQLLNGLKYVTANFALDQLTCLDWQSILWASMIARMCAQDQPLDEDVGKLIEAAVQKLALANVADVIASLHHFVWPEGWGADKCERIMRRY